MPILFRETKGDIRVLYNGRLPRLQNSLDGFCQSSVRVGEVVSRIYFEVVRDSHFIEESQYLFRAVSYAAHDGMFRVAFVVAQ